MGLWMVLFQWDIWPGRAELWGAGDWPCWGLARARADRSQGLTWGPGPWAGLGSPRSVDRDSQVRQCPQDPGRI